MFDMWKSKFYKKSKKFLKRLKTRIDTIRKKRNVVNKFLRSDIAELLKSGHDVKAYGRAEGLLVELNISSCYDFVDQCVMCISGHLGAMENQRECPTECREAVPSLVHAAARFGDLPELRDLRTLFTDRYGTALDHFVNEEFVEKLRAGPPTKEKKFQLMKEIARENSIQWDPMFLEQRMFKPTAPAQDKPNHQSSQGTEDNRGNQHKRNDIALPGRDGHNDGNKTSVMDEYDMPKRNEREFTHHGRKVVPDDGYNVPLNSDDDVASNYRRDSTSQDSQRTSSSSVRSSSEDEGDSRNPFYYGLIPPPYVKHKATTESTGFVNAKQNNPQCHTVNTLKPPPGREIVDNGSENCAEKAEKAQQLLHSILQNYDEDQSDDEEKRLDELLMYYSKKKPPGQESDDDNGAARIGHSNARANPYPSLGQHYDETNEERKHRSARSELPHPPARATSIPLDQAAAHEATRGHARAKSLEPDMLTRPGHVHPKLPDYDDLAARLAALRGP